MAKAAEADWTKVSNQVNDLLETASSGSSSFGIELLAADMVAANGYIVSMRVVANEPSENGGPASPGIAAPEVGGSSSSHVSISSAFSSSSQSSRF